VHKRRNKKAQKGAKKKHKKVQICDITITSIQY